MMVDEASLFPGTELVEGFAIDDLRKRVIRRKACCDEENNKRLNVLALNAEALPSNLRQS
jgi:hypothetical protein